MIVLLLPWASYLSPTEGRQNENHNHRKLTNLITWTTSLSNSRKLWAMYVGPPKTDRSWWRVLTKRGPLEKGMANLFSILALRSPCYRLNVYSNTGSFYFLHVIYFLMPPSHTCLLHLSLWLKKLNLRQVSVDYHLLHPPEMLCPELLKTLCA